MPTKTKTSSKRNAAARSPLARGSTILAFMRRYTKMLGSKNEYRVLLEIDHQGFFIDGYHTRKQANWYRRCIAIALHRLVSNSDYRAPAQITDRAKQ